MALRAAALSGLFLLAISAFVAFQFAQSFEAYPGYRNNIAGASTLQVQEETDSADSHIRHLTASFWHPKRFRKPLPPDKEEPGEAPAAPEEGAEKAEAEAVTEEEAEEEAEETGEAEEETGEAEEGTGEAEMGEMEENVVEEGQGTSEEQGSASAAAARKAALRAKAKAKTVVDYKKMPADCSITPAVVDYTVRRIRSVKPQSRPYPHVYITDVFPEPLYACIVQNLPPETTKAMRLYSKMKNSRRYTLPLMKRAGQKTITQIAEDYHVVKQTETGNVTISGTQFINGTFWEQFGKAFGGPKVRDAWMSKFKNTIGKRFRGRMKFSEFSQHLDLSRDIGGYDIGPHTDSLNKFVTTLYYLPRDRTLDHLGTVVVKSKSGRQQVGTKWEKLADRDFVVTKKASFAPNSVFAFAPCLWSWHAVPRVKPPPGRVVTTTKRNTIQGFIRLNKGNSAGIQKARC